MSLSEADFAKAGLDLTSWVLEDDLYQHQDFRYGAKEAQSISAGVAEGSSSFQPLMGSQDVPMETGNLKWSDVCKFDEYFAPLKKEEDAPSFVTSPVAAPNTSFEGLLTDDLDLQQLMKEEIVLQQRFDQLQFFKQQEQEELLKQQRQQELIRKQQEEKLLRDFEQEAARQRIIQEQQQQQQQQQQSLFQSHSYSHQPAVQEISYQDSLSAPSISYVSSPTSPVYFVSSPSTSEFKEETSLSAPYIISVPVSDALIEDVKPSIVDSTSHFVIEEESHQIPDQEMKQEFPPKLVINVKKVSLPHKSCDLKKSKAAPFAGPSATVSGFPTLKEALQGGSQADDFMREMIDCPRVFDSSIDSAATSCDEGSFSDDLSPFSPSSYSSVTPTDMPSTPRSARVKGCRGNPYTVTEKRLRKKEQNKRAALRYRQKKKDEEGDVLMTLRKEEERQKQLLEKYESVKTELKLMKKLAREMLIAQGKLKR